MAVLSLSRALLLAGAALPMTGFAQTITNQEGEVIRRLLSDRGRVERSC
jgi:hypothetical protein